jgi:hypothetical protein
MTQRYRYDYYTVALPGDLADTLEVLAECAVTEARERARQHALNLVLCCSLRLPSGRSCWGPGPATAR